MRSKQAKTGKQIQTEILNYLHSQCRGFVVAYKVVLCNENGVPDIICCIHGRFVALEVKGNGDKLSEIQKAQMERIHNASGEAYVVESLDDVKQILKDYMI